jgi:putative spermidine/putrescine transport system permease protein
VLATIFGLLAALGIVRGRFIARETLQAFFRLPVQIPLIVTGAVFLQFYYQIAAVLDINLLSGIGGLIIAHLFVATPYAIGAISAVLVRIDPAIEEAAQSLGATDRHTFAYVTFPMLRPGIIAGFFYGFIISFGDVPIAIFLANPKAMTLPVRIFQDMQFDFRPSMLAMSSIVVMLSLIVIIAMQRLAGLDLVIPSGKK